MKTHCMNAMMGYTTENLEEFVARLLIEKSTDTECIQQAYNNVKTELFGSIKDSL
ncbi:MAG: hypothetical protein KBT36_04785 [Kurthia sp.]|nr:hypothetical protein [Candidatus Kurthia equi]